MILSNLDTISCPVRYPIKTDLVDSLYTEKSGERCLQSFKNNTSCLLTFSKGRIRFNVRILVMCIL